MFTSDDIICIILTLKRGVVQRLKNKGGGMKKKLTDKQAAKRQSALVKIDHVF